MTAEPTTEPEPDGPQSDREMPLIAHLDELRFRLVRCAVIIVVAFLACYSQSPRLVDFFTRPLKNALPPGSHIQFTTITEPFLVHMKVSFVASLIVSFPLVCYQIWAFVSPGLYKREKKMILPFVMAASLAFAAGVVFCFTVAFPFGFRYLIEGYATPDIIAVPRLDDYFGQALTMLVAFGLVFELPVICFVLGRLGILSARGMLGSARVAILVIAIVAAVLSPPDVISMGIIGIPMLGLYFGSVVVVAVVEKKRPPEPPGDADDEAEADDGEDVIDED